MYHLSNVMFRKSKLAASSKAVDPALAALFAESVSDPARHISEMHTDILLGQTRPSPAQDAV